MKTAGERAPWAGAGSRRVGPRPTYASSHSRPPATVRGGEPRRKPEGPANHPPGRDINASRRITVSRGSRSAGLPAACDDENDADRDGETAQGRREGDRQGEGEAPDGQRNYADEHEEGSQNRGRSHDRKLKRYTVALATLGDSAATTGRPRCVGPTLLPVGHQTPNLDPAWRLRLGLAPRHLRISPT